MNPAAPPARDTFIDTLRGVSILGVVCIHFGGSFVDPAHAWSPSFHLGLALNQLFSFAVPLFLFLAGALSARGRAPVSLGAYYRSRLTRIGLPYLAASAVSFFTFHHAAAWLALPDHAARAAWLADRLLYRGVEATLYFIPLILALYLLQPLLRALPGWLQARFLPRARVAHVAAALTLLFLAVHVTLGILCYRNVLSYYTWGRPCPLFWLFYFFAGLHLRDLAGLVPARLARPLALLGLGTAAALMAANGWHLLDRTAVGEDFSRAGLDYAYVRPVILSFNLAIVGAAALALHGAWFAGREGLIPLFGRHSLGIYLWHILLLYQAAWRHPEVLAACRELPELIILFSFATCLALAQAARLLAAGPRIFRLTPRPA